MVYLTVDRSAQMIFLLGYEHVVSKPNGEGGIPDAAPRRDIQEVTVLL
jgi:hypothetical protein